MSTPPDISIADSSASPPHSGPSKVIRTVFLDRDGVINRKLPEGEYVSSWESFSFLPGVPQAIARLNRAGLRVLVVTNQRGVALGKYSAETVAEIHQNLQNSLVPTGAKIDGFYFCPHDKKQCDCRKPLPGLFHQAQANFPDITTENSLVIGDSLSDIEFGRRLGLKTVFIEGDPANRKAGAEKAAGLATITVSDLPEAISRLLLSTD